MYGETCPQYFFLTADDLDRPEAEGTKFCCSPPPRDEADHEAMWRGVVNDTFQVVSSDHAPYRFDSSGKLAHGTDPDFKHVANGIPGIEVRLPLLFSEGVGKGRIDLQRFVELSSTNAARLYGLEDRKGSIKVGRTRISRSGTRTSRSPSPSTCSTTTWTTPPTKAAG